MAVVHAQAQAAITTVDFIKSVGFHPQAEELVPGADAKTADPIYVTFRYPKEIAPYQPGQPEVPAGVDADGNATPLIPEVKPVDAVVVDQELKVPILTLLPIPYIRIEETTIDFNAKITSVEYTKTDSSYKVDKTLSGRYGNWLVGSVKMKVTSSYQRNSTQGNSVNRTYSLAVHVRAVQDEMPAGMEKILGILEGAIQSTPVEKV